MEKKDLARILKLSWSNDRIGSGKDAFTGGVSLLWDIDSEELEGALPVFYQSSKPAPVLLLDSVANSEKPPAESLNALLSLQDDIWQCAQGQIMEIAPSAESEEQLLSFVNAFNVQIEQLPSVAARRNLGFIPGLCYRLLPLLAIFADREEEDLIIAAKGMTAALARRHFSALHQFTAGFTAEPLRNPDNPAEVLAEYQILAKIDKYAPVTRTKLNAMHSNDNRKLLDVRLARLIRDGRVAVDDRGRFSVRSVMSV